MLYIYIYTILYIYIWVNYNDRTLFSRTLEIIVNFMGNHPHMAEQFRLMNHYNLPGYMCHPGGPAREMLNLRLDV